VILVWDKSFKRAFKRLVKKNPRSQKKVFDVLDLLSNNPSAPSLKSHKLTGQLEGLWSCSVAYDCRIVYSFREDKVLGTTVIVLIDIGTHDDVY
jgi:addiction module RelE/StbE family toxin